ncbi:uncharacterized protein LOC130209400 isoform X2 [Pseudoliparis swirei]|nr:uncharacterized protein LOC130209400 isoform X2 [Pseudoliparis swirei]
MLLLYATVACVLFGGSFADVMVKEKCYGGYFNLPYFYAPPLFNGQLYFTPSNSASRQLVIDKGESRHPRFKVKIGSVQFTDLTENDDGAFSNDEGEDVVILIIKDCASKVMRYYGEIYSRHVPRQAEFLEFTPLHNMDQSTVLWNRTDPRTNKGGRGQMRRNEWVIENLNRADMGHYNFRAKDNTLLSRILLKVREQTFNYTSKVNERLLIPNPAGNALWTVTFSTEEKKEHILMQTGRLLTEDGWSSLPFTGRMLDMRNGLEINPVEITDSGTFEFIDPQGDLAQTVHLLVKPDSVSTFVYVGIVVGIVFAVIVCCCCVRKCCCKKSSSKRTESAPQTAATPSVYNHDMNQPAGPSYSAVPAPDHSTHYSRNSLVSKERKTISLEPLGYNPVNIDVNPPLSEVAPLGGQGGGPAPLLGSDCLSSGPEPTFELKGVYSALPLGSSSTFCDVYTSDKLNFL